MSDTRVIPVRKEWLAELMSLLRPEERFVTKDMHLCLWTLPAKQLVFMVDESLDDDDARDDTWND